jgi:pimeloyl-ACP methyl ester carboxylesterase
MKPVRQMRAWHTYRQWPILICVQVLVCAAACTGTAQAAAIEWQSCALDGSGAGVRRYAECAELEVPLNPHDDATNAHITLAVARIRSAAPKAVDDAVLAINGGPGGSSRDLLVDLWPAFAMLARERDVIVVDQRGTGASSPLRCNQDPLMEGTDAENTRVQTRRCLGELGVDPRHFTTSQAVADLEAVRRALGVQQWNIYGVSYGTRVAAHYARRYPDRIRSIILDGVVAPTQILGANVVRNSQQALEALDRRCSADPSCTQAYGALLPKLELLKESLAESVHIGFAHPVTGRPTHIDLGFPHVAAAIRLLLYAPETAAIIPVMIDEAVNGNLVPLAAQALLMLERVEGSIADGMHNAVVCTEDIPFFGAAEEDRAALESAYLGAGMIDTLKSICAIWPAGQMDPDLHAPWKSDIPAMLISGEFDPITPPANAEIVRTGLSRSRTFIASGQGHGVLGRGCMPRLVGEFLDTLDPGALDATCLTRTATMAPFVNLMGPTP